MLRLSCFIFQMSLSVFRALQQPDIVPRPRVQQRRRPVTRLVMSFSMPTWLVMICEVLCALRLHELSKCAETGMLRDLQHLAKMAHIPKLAAGSTEGRVLALVSFSAF